MKLKIGALILIAMCVSGGTLASAEAPRRETPLILAQTTHAQLCQANLDQCLKGCDGAESCSRQCRVNYDGCMAQGG